MTTDPDSLWAFLGAAGIVSVATPAAIAIAHRTEFYDHPGGYKGHGAPTPYLGGGAVMAGLTLVLVVLGDTGEGLAWLLGCAALLWMVGTIDDRVAVRPAWRLLAAAAVALFLYQRGLGWRLTHIGAVDLALTVVWVVGLVNAFNLMDNLDGATSTVAAMSAAGIGTLALEHSAPVVGAASFALAGACVGFLRFNLARPCARIFLGDGGSMPIGLLIAGLAMIAAGRTNEHGAGLLGAAMFAGLPILDVALVSISRRRRGLRLVTAGRDHLTHRLLRYLGSPRAVAGVLAGLQGLLCGLSIAGDSIGRGGLIALACVSALLGAFAIVALDVQFAGARRLRRPLRATIVDPGIDILTEDSLLEPATEVAAGE